MLKWIDIIRFANNGIPAPDKRVEKSEAEWRELLSPEVFTITRQKGTERAHSSAMCSLFEPGRYNCACCNTPLFDATEKFDSGSGWPSFTQPLKENAVDYIKDTSFGMQRVEITCAACDAHLGHVFPDGPEPSGLRYCVNALSLKKAEVNVKTITLGGGCFWCTEAVFLEVKGVTEVKSGFSGGKIANPTYREVCSGLTKHAEVIHITYNPAEITFSDLVFIHLLTHDPTTLNRQGADIGEHYRSVIFYTSEEEKNAAETIINKVQEAYDKPIVTTLEEFQAFYPAEDYHQNYYNQNREQGYCQVVIDPKLNKLRTVFKEYLKTSSEPIK